MTVDGLTDTEREADKQAALARDQAAVMQLPTVPVAIDRATLAAAFASMGIDAKQLHRADFRVHDVELEFLARDSLGGIIPGPNHRFATVTVRVPIVRGKSSDATA